MNRLLILLMISCALLGTSAKAQSFKQLGELVPASRSTNDWFGLTSAISGNTLVVGDFDPNFQTTGTAHVFVKPASGWGNTPEAAILVPSDNGAYFGTSVAISGDTIVVGAANTSNFDAPATAPGAVYVFVKPAAGWSGTLTEAAKLVASDGLSGDAFGNAVSIDHSTIAVGAFFVNNFAGRVYVFTGSGSSWTQAAELTASDGGLLSYLGGSVAVRGNTVVAGSIGQNNFQGAAYVFVEPASGWSTTTQTAELTSATGKSNEHFGSSVSIAGNTIVAGDPGAGNNLGAAYVYVRPASGWDNSGQYNASLRALDSTQYGGFGGAVALAGNGKTIVVGAAGANVGSNLEQGAAYVYVRPSIGWRSTKAANAELLASDGTQADLMGASVGIDGVTIIAGAPKSSSPGATYIFAP
ncbi:MAG: hypothetical protein DMG79_21750 [Acidobacteria bacterium]|nr:MAG: hypothetical protein DMG79_21750 [Acidobacteriota bacterium]